MSAFPDRPAKPTACTNDFLASRNARRVFGPTLCIAAGGDDGTGIACRDGIVAGLCIVSPIGAHARDDLILWICSSSSGNMGASPTRLPVTSIARFSSVSASTPRWILRHCRRLDGPCLRLHHSPSPTALMPVLSISRCNGPELGWQGILTRRVFCRRLSVLKSGTGQSSPTISRRLATMPVVWRKGSWASMYFAGDVAWAVV